MSDFQVLRNRTTISAIIGTATGVIIWFVPNSVTKTLGQFIAVASLGSLAATQLVTDSSEKIAEKWLNNASKDYSKVSNELSNQKRTNAKLSEEIQNKDLDIAEKASLIKQLFQDKTELQTLLAVSKAEVEKYANQFDSINKANSDIAIEILNESFAEFQSQIESLISKLSHRYPDLKDWESLAKNYQQEVDNFTNKIAVIAEYTNPEDLIEGSLAVQHEIIYRGSLLKLKAYKSVVNHLNSQLNNVISLEEHNQTLQHLKAVYNKNIQSIREEYGALVDTSSEEFQQHLTEICQQGLSDAETIESLQVELFKLKQKLAEISKPHRFPGNTEQSRVGNSIIDYYHRVGITLDAIEWDSNETGYKLLFHVGRNGSRFISADILNDNDAPEKLKEVSGAINTPEFVHNVRGGHMVLEVQTRYRIKTTKEDEISRLWISSSQFEAKVKGWSRVRITGGSESGKSPTAENLAIAILKNRPGVVKLYNPQHDSIKNYWTIPVSGISHSDSEDGIAELAQKVDARSNSRESREQFELCIFDEIDSTMSHCTGDKKELGAHVNFIIKQASHQNLGAIFIGQSANVSQYPGMQRTDWNSAVNLHIGANAYDAIENSNQFTSEEKNKLKTIADKLTAFCESKNDELELEKTDATAYRFAFVIEPNKKPYFIELPAFGLYTYEGFEPVQQTKKTVKPICPNCGSDKIRSKGEYWVCENPLHSELTSQPKQWKKIF